MARIYSHSLLKSYRYCQAAGLTFRDMPRYEKAGPARAGQAAHAVAHAYTQHLYTEGYPSDIEFGRTLVEDVCIKLSPEDRAFIEPSLLDFIALDFSWVNGIDDPVWEQRIHRTREGKFVPAHEVEHESGWLFAFTADLSWRDADHRLHVLDWKSGWKPDHIDDPAENEQLLDYCAASTWGGGGAVGHIFHTRHGYQEEAEFPEHVLEDRRRSLVALIDSLDVLTKATYSTGVHCLDCDLRRGCEAYRNLPPAEEDDLAGQIVVLTSLEDRMTGMKDAVREAVGEAGEIDLGSGRVAVMKIEDRWTFDGEKVRAILAEYLDAASIEAAFTASKTSIENAVKKAPGMTKDLREQILEKVKAAGTNKPVDVLRISKKGKGR
jgi:hypothetical protein